MGAWAAIVLVDDNKQILTGKAIDTTHQRMELMAVIKSLEYIREHHPQHNSALIISDSQYVVDLPDRQQKLVENNFITKAGKPIQNSDLLRQLFSLLQLLRVSFEKIKAHQKKTGTHDFNIEVDKLSRKLVREESLKPQP